jgi:hypothetical protein
MDKEDNKFRLQDEWIAEKMEEGYRTKFSNATQWEKATPR